MAVAAPEASQGQALPGPGGAIGAGGLVRSLEELIPRRMRAHDVPGLNVLVLRAGEEVWSGSFGWADVESERPMALDAVFRVESISKPVTAWGVIQLAGSGVLDLDEPLEAQLRSWTPPTGLPPFTPRQLLSHTAGVGLGDFTARYAAGGPRPPLTASLESEIVMVGRPGDGFSYSDTGYNLLEVLVQDVTGEDFGSWMNGHVLEPLGMHSSTFDWDVSFADRVPVAYDLKGRRVDPYVYPGRASGGLFSTLHDVGRFAQADVGAKGSHAARADVPASQEGVDPLGEVGPDPVLSLLHTPVVRPRGMYGLVAEGYGLGHFTETLSDGRTAVWHGGQGYGWMTHVHIVPETGDAIVLLANSQRAWPLFAHVLRAWSTSLGVAPVRMSRIVWAAPVAWGGIVALLGGAGLLVARTLSRRSSHGGPGRRSTRPSRPARWARVTAFAVGLALVGLVVWAAIQDYLFLFSILPAATGWLGVALSCLGGALIAWATIPEAMGPHEGGGTMRAPTSGMRSRIGGIGLLTALLGWSAAGLEAQMPAVQIEAGWMPSSDVTRSLSGPATQARVFLVRGSVLIPLVVQRQDLVVVPRISASRVGITPSPIDPREPVWVEALYDLDLELVGQVTLSDRDRLSVVLAPGVASDFRGLRSDHLTVQGAALLTRVSSSGRVWGGGLSLTNAFGEVLVLPLLAYQWGGRRFHADLLAPARGEVFWTPAPGVGVGVQALIDGNVYGLGRSGTLQDGRVRYSLADVGPVIRYDLGWGLRLSGSAGLSFRRRLEVEDADGRVVEDALLGRGWRMGLGLSWMLREDP